MLCFVGSNATEFADDFSSQIVVLEDFVSQNPDPVMIVQESFQSSQHQCQHEEEEPKTGDVASVSASLPCKAGTLPQEVKAQLPKKRKVSTEDVQKLQIEVLQLEKDKLALEIENVKLINKKLMFEVREMESKVITDYLN